MSLLSDILQRTRADLVERRSRLPLSELRRRAEDMAPPKSLKNALSKGFSIIGEIKRRSPSAGEMNSRNVADALEVYNDSLIITAISVLTDEPFFGGSLDRLWQARKATSKPILRKDFIVDEYQVWEARAFGADAILLMAAVHEENPGQLGYLYEVAKSLGLQALVEIGMSQAGPEKQAAIIPRDAEICGINSRQFHSSRLKLRMRVSKLLGQDFMTSPNRHRQLRHLIPLGKIAVAESGIDQPQEIDALVNLGYNAALIGTAFLKGPRRVVDVVAAFAERIANLTQATADIDHSDLAWQRTAPR
jgi:indole-3-glycerol phosphate synthase